jgi:hypothetical protein
LGPSAQIGRVEFISDDPDGMRVERTAVISVRPEVDGWTVVTLAGTERVNAEGEGSRLVPLDPEMAAEFEDRGSSFVVRSTAEGIEQNLDTALDWRRLSRISAATTGLSAATTVPSIESA